MIFAKQRDSKNQTTVTQVGDRFAIQYGQLSTPLYRLEEHSCHHTMIEKNFHNINMDEISNLWTVVEYIGENKFIDLVTGEIYIEQENIDSVKDTVTREYEDEAQNMYCDLVEHPLGLRKISQLTTEIKQKIMEETMPIQEKVILILEKKKKNAQKLVLDFYRRKNRAKLHRLFNEATIENNRRNEEIRRQKEIEDKRRQEEETRQAAIRLREEVDSKFDMIFPTTKRKILINLIKD